MKKLSYILILFIFFSCEKEVRQSTKQQLPTDKVLELSKEKEATLRTKPLPPKNPHNNPVDTTTEPQPPSLSSSGCLLVIFNGRRITDPYWNGGITFDCDSSGLTTTQQAAVLNRVQHDYTQFPLTVTTDETLFNTFPENKRMLCVVTKTWQWYAYVGGVAYMNSYLWYGKKHCFVFSSLLGFNTNNVGVACSHEFGHTLGDRHQLEYDANGNVIGEYSHGDGVHAPIMGYPYDLPAIWWIGPVQNDTLTIHNTVYQ